MGAAVTVILVRERQLVDAFVAAGATDPAHAVTASDVGMEPTRVAARRLLDRGIIRQADRGLYYLDVDGWSALHRRRQRLAMVLLAILALGLVALGLTSLVATRSP